MVESTSDERTVNNVARHEYRILSDDEKASVRAIKDKGLEFIELCNSIEESGFREPTDPDEIIRGACVGSYENRGSDNVGCQGDYGLK